MDIKRINIDRDYLEWDELHYDYWEVFNDPQDLTYSEIVLAKKYLDMMGIDINQQHIISFRAAPVHFAHMIVNFIRRMESQNPGFFSGNFAEDIEDDI